MNHLQVSLYAYTCESVGLNGFIAPVLDGYTVALDDQKQRGIVRIVGPIGILAGSGSHYNQTEHEYGGNRKWKAVLHQGLPHAS